MLVTPVVKYSSNSPGLRATILIFSMLGGLHILNFFSLIVQRSGKPFTSRVWRRIFSNIPFKEFGLIALLMVILIVPFAAAISSEAQTPFVEELIASLGGGYFRDNVKSTFELCLKMLAIIFIFMPMKVMMIARVISSFLSNKPNSFTSLHEEICEVIANSGVLDRQDKSFHVLKSDYYRLTRKISQIFSPLSFENLKVDNFKDVETLYKRLNPPVFLFEYEGPKRKK